MRIRLTVTDDPDLALEVSTGEMVLIGRGNGADLQLTDPRVSRAHCRIVIEDGRVLLFDSGSAWGTQVNGERVDHIELQPGDDIRVGETRLDLVVLRDSTTTTLRPRSDARPATAAAEGLEHFAIESGEDGDTSSSADITENADIGPSADDLLGTTINSLRLHAILDRTPSGVLYRGSDQVICCDVAVKVFHREVLGTPAQRQRFERAMRTAAPLRHDNIIMLREFGEAHGLSYSVSEFIEGESVSDLIRRIGVSGMLDWSHAFHVAHGVALALDYAAGFSIVHRNITPRNILICDSDHCVKLGDLTLAKAAAGAGQEQITAAGEIVGNLAYLSPEQTVDEDRADARTDIYTLGAVTYALLTGRPPVESASPAEALRQIQTVRPKPPTEFQMSIPPLFEGIVMRMLEKRPEDRFQSAADLLRDLDRARQYIPSS